MRKVTVPSSLGFASAIVAASMSACGEPRLVVGDVNAEAGAAPTFSDERNDGGIPAPQRAMCPTDECPTGWTSCSSNPFPCGVDLRSDENNCGACGNVCPPSLTGSGASACIDGVCRFACAPSRADCNGIIDDECEIDIVRDMRNCGACGNTCTDICFDGHCGCPSGTAFCDPGCTDLEIDANNCGRCGNVCPPNPKPPLPPEWQATYDVCSGGDCTYPLACVHLWADCNRDLGDADGNGCETSIEKDPENCGGCGRRCAPGEVCTGGICHCPCGNICFDPTNDVSNCGGCNVLCPGPSDLVSDQPAWHGKPVCDDGVCDYRCAADWGDCDNDIANGCETNLRSDPFHCGSCVSRCDGVEGQACVDGQCTTKECTVQ